MPWAPFQQMEGFSNVPPDWPLEFHHNQFSTNSSSHKLWKPYILPEFTPQKRHKKKNNKNTRICCFFQGKNLHQPLFLDPNKIIQLNLQKCPSIRTCGENLGQLRTTQLSSVEHPPGMGRSQGWELDDLFLSDCWLNIAFGVSCAYCCFQKPQDYSQHQHSKDWVLSEV